MYRKEIVEKVGGFRVGFEGAQDYDLLLRVLEHCSEKQVRHIPKVLYSWRTSPGSKASERSEKKYAVEAGRLALEEHLTRQNGVKVGVREGAFPFTYRVDWPITEAPLVSLIIPTRDMVNVLRVAVESILEKTTYENYEIIIVDNGSQKAETLSWFREIQAFDTRVRVVSDSSPFNYSRLNNRAVRMAKGEVLGLVNNDVEVISPDWLTEMVSLTIRDDVGCVGAKLYYPDDTVQHAGVVIGMGGVAGHTHLRCKRGDHGYFTRLCNRQEYSAVTAACLLVEKDIYQEVGGLNENELTVAFNDVDFCLKVGAAGYRNVWTPYAELYHYESISRGYEDTPEKLTRFNREKRYMIDTWATDKFRDPAYNANLTLKRSDFSIGEPQWEL
ncbi:GT2 family glycosyltransferase [Donghicola tyrosinivorans]|uniref:GT2 family glycosyltransferase n=1 Tax=Donghicola tyrosinivorans TaxID=1652492 RepID=A0A2T0X5C5_9RHOB|nr:GT2 family glycosyltransferase [Donghicola tyrosinivorans]